MNLFPQSIKRWCSDIFGTRKYLRYREKEDRLRRITGQILTLITAVLGTIYLCWHFLHINWSIWYYSCTFFIGESTGLLLFCFFSFNAWFLRYHAPEGIASERSLSVDIFIPVAGEPIELVRKTMEAALQIDFQNKQIYMLDDKNNAECRQLADNLGCGYFAREEHDNAKAGNLNYALQRTDGDLILALDADQVPQPEIINRLIGYFKIPQVGFVQSKQRFKVPVGDPFGNSDHIFYNIMQSGKDNDNSAFSCGSGVVYRRKALEDIGGFSTWNVVEDVHTSMLLHERGWRSVYYNHHLTAGTAPADIYGVYRQRRQWAVDSLRIEFWDNPFRSRHKGLSFKQKMQYFHLGFVYLVAAFIMPLFFITPIISLLVNGFILTASVREYVIHRFPYFLAMSLAYGIVNYPTPYMRAFQMWTGLFPVFIHATWMALCSRKKKPAYHVNPKPTGKVTVKRPWLAVLPQLAIIFSGLFAVFYSFFKGEMYWDCYLLNCLWIIWSMWTMSGICKAALKKHKWPIEGITERVPSFFKRTQELIATIIVTIAVTIFFTMVKPTTINRFMNDLRSNAKGMIGMEDSIPSAAPQNNRAPLSLSGQDVKVVQKALPVATTEPKASPSPVLAVTPKTEASKKTPVNPEDSNVHSISVQPEKGHGEG